MDIDSVWERLHKKSELNVGVGLECREWLGGVNKDGYGVLKVKINDQYKVVSAHRLAYWVFIGHCDTVGYDASHLCHNKKCIRIDHISMEPTHINQSRKHCSNEGRCFTHHGYLDCLFPCKSVFIIYTNMHY